MSQANFAYGEAGRGSAFSAGVYAAAPANVGPIREAAEAAGFVLLDYELLAELDDVPPPLPADVLVIECPVQDGATLAALVQLDTRAAREGTRLIVSTTMSALDSVFGCLELSDAEILLQPSKGERVIALARALLKGPAMTVRELDDADRLTLLRLTEQVGQIAAQLDRLSAGEARAFRLESPTDGFHEEGDEERRLIRSARPPLPDPRLIRRIIASAARATSSSVPSCSPTRRGTSCSTSLPRAPSTSGSRSPRYASPAACRRRPRCAGSTK